LSRFRQKIRPQYGIYTLYSNNVEICVQTTKSPDAHSLLMTFLKRTLCIVIGTGWGGGGNIIVYRRHMARSCAFLPQIFFYVGLASRRVMKVNESKIFHNI